MVFGRGNSKPAVLVYHSIGGSGFFSISPEIFEQQIVFLKNNGVSFIGLDDLMKKDELKDKSVLITFDDGYEDNFLNAVPILEKYKIPAVFFMPTDFIGKELSGVKVMTWEELKTLSQNPLFEIGSHGVAHKRLPRLDNESIRKEVLNSKKELEENLGIFIRSFAYPYGRFNEFSIEQIKASGYNSAFSAYPENINRIKDFYSIPRFSVDNFSKDFFKDFFTGGYGFYWKVRLLFKIIK